MPSNRQLQRSPVWLYSLKHTHYLPIQSQAGMSIVHYPSKARRAGGRTLSAEPMCALLHTPPQACTGGAPVPYQVPRVTRRHAQAFVGSPYEHKATCPGRPNLSETFLPSQELGTRLPHSSLWGNVDLLAEPGQRKGAEFRPRAGGPAAVHSLTLPNFITHLDKPGALRQLADIQRKVAQRGRGGLTSPASGKLRP